MARFLALDWDDGRLLLLEGSTGKAGARIERAFAWPEELPPGPTNADAIGTRLKQRLKDSGIAAAPLLIALGRDRIVLKEIRFPTVPLHEEPGIVRFQAMKEMSDGEDVVLDYQAVDAPDASGERKALATAVKKNLATAYQTLARTAGLKLAAITPRGFGALAGVRRTAQPPPDAGSAIAVLTVGGHGGEFTVGRGEYLAFSRAVAPAALGADAALLSEMRRNLAVYSGQSSQAPVQALYVAESPGSLGVADRLRDSLAIPVHAFDPLAGLPVPDGARTGAFAGAAGLIALRGLNRPLPINYLQPREPKPPRDPNRRAMAWAGGIAAAILLCLVAFGWSRLSAKDKELAALVEARSDLDRDLVALDQDDRRYKAIQEWRDNEVVWLDELYDLTAAVPNIDKMRVTHIIANPIAVGSGSSKTNKYAARVELKGLVTDDTKPLTALTRELDVDGFHRVEARTTSQNTGATRRQFIQQWSTKFDVEKRLDEKDKRGASRYERKFTATPPPRRQSGPGGFDMGALGGLLP